MRQELRDALSTAWLALGEPGVWWTGAERVKIAGEDVVEEPVIEPGLGEGIPGYDEEARIQYTGGLSEDIGDGSLAE